jgi:hypothetical protein
MFTRAKAYSLLEMVVAGFIFATVAVALAGVFSYHYKAIGSSRLFLVAQHLGRSRMEECLGAGYLRAPQLADGANPPAVFDAEFMIRDQPILARFTIATVVVEGPDVPGLGPPDEGPLNCTVTVSWEEANRTRNVRFSATISPEA